VRRLERRWQGSEFPSFSDSPLRELGTKVEEITCLLESRYGIPRKRRRADPLDILIQTILSQNTHDRNRDLAYQRLKSRFPSWEDVAKAKTKAIVQAIRPGGLADQKARCIQEILKWIKEHNGRLNLDFLQKMRSEEIKETIGKLKGVGPKTVYCLLLFGMGREAFPVDTHVLRVGKRLGFIPSQLDAKKAHRWMVPLIPKGKSLSLHLNLIRLGRSICKAKKPHCDICFLTEECLQWIMNHQGAHHSHEEVV